MIKEDDWIKLAATKMDMIFPFVPVQVSRNEQGEGILSYGLSSFGYDIRIADEFAVVNRDYSGILDPKNPDPDLFVDIVADTLILEPNGFALARSLEYIRVPRNVLCVVLGKSTYARAGIVINVTPLEPEWEGHITIEISNTTPLPVAIYANEGIGQILFFQGSYPDTTYAQRSGKYQGQRGITLGKV